MRASFFCFAAFLFLSVPCSAHAQECRDDGTPRAFEERYADLLGAAAAGAVLGAGAGAVLGLAIPAIVCPAGVGDDGCDAAWAVGVGGFGGTGWVLGLPMGMAATEAVRYDEAQAGEGLSVIAAALFAGGGALVADSTHDETWFFAGMIGWAVTQVLLAPLFALAFHPSPRCVPRHVPLP